MQVTLKRINEAVLMEAENESGNTVRIDGGEKVGGVEGGLRPMQLLLAAVGGCSIVDIISILRKQRQDLAEVDITVSGEREDNAVPSVFTEIHVHYTFVGNLEADKVARAVELGIEKYCSVAEMLKHTATITHSHEIRVPT